MTGRVYLSGPITGLSYEGCTDWREKVSRALAAHGIDALSPMRGKAFLREAGVITDDMQAVQSNPMSKDKAIVARDLWDTTRADFLLVNLLGAQRVSIGTMFELAWAHDHHIPVVLVMEESGNCHEHAFVREAASYRVTTILAAIAIIAVAIHNPTYI